MKKFLCILALIVAGFALNTCSTGDDDYGKVSIIQGTKYYVQSHNLESLEISYLILENGWKDGKIQACYNLYTFTIPGTIKFSGSNATISGLKNPAASLNGTWRYEYDDEYDVHILRKGSEYVIFW